jgi:hypothetical protein
MNTNHFRWKPISLVLLLFGIGLFTTSCGRTLNTDELMEKTQETQLKNATQEAGMPNITNFTELKQFKRLYELRDKAKLPTYTYLASLGGKPVFLFRSFGFGLPASVQFSNPQKIVSQSSSVGFGTLPQAEPNGLFMPSSAEGTWIVQVDDGVESVAYVEPRVIIVQRPLPGIPIPTAK